MTFCPKCNKSPQCKYFLISKICCQNWHFEILHFQSGKALWSNIFENHNQSFQMIFFFEKTAKKWNAAPRQIVARLKPLKFTIFKALGKKGGWRKQVHLWQVSKASQLQYYLVTILQDNASFTRLKIARRFLSSALSEKNEILGNFKRKNHGLVHQILEESLYLSKALLFLYNIWKIQLGQLQSNQVKRSRR